MTSLLVLEWSREAAEIAEFEAMLREETEWSAWFCWSDAMVPGFGLIDAQGNPTESYTAFKAAQEEDPVAEPNDAIKQTMAEFEAAGGAVGQVYAVDDVGEFQIASTDAGQFISRTDMPGAFVMLDARTRNPFK